MGSRKKFSFDKFEKDRDKATKLSKSGFRLDTLSDDIYRTITAIQNVAHNAEKLNSEEYEKLDNKSKNCGDMSVLKWCTLPLVNRIRPECKVCMGNS
jgi:hypothetical protein